MRKAILTTSLIILAIVMILLPLGLAKMCFSFAVFYDIGAGKIVVLVLPALIMIFAGIVQDCFFFVAERRIIFAIHH